ncbi:MAG TPA: 50S ribosomal protein L1 [Candidatus Gracilibacteria bacterium]
MKRSKAWKSSSETIGIETLYSIEDGIKLLKSSSKVKFDATAEVHYNLGIDPRHADQQIRTTVTLPHGTGKVVKVVVFCEDEHIKSAKAAGAIEAGGDDLVEKVIKGWTDFDVAIATPSMMKSLAKAARVLGPKGLMPNPKSGTVTTDIEKTVKEVMGGRLEFRNDKHGIIHSKFGKLSFSEADLVENFKTLHNAILEAKPTGSKGTYIKTVTICSTMSPGIKLDLAV